MRPEFEKYSEIDNYLNGKLSEQENTAFEKRMEEDPELHELVFDRKVMQEIIIENRFFEITGSIRTAPTGYQSLLSKSVKRFLGIGAAITVFLFTPYYFIQQNNKNSDTRTLSLDQEQENEAVITASPEVEEVEEIAAEEFVVDSVFEMPTEEIETPVIDEPKNTTPNKKTAVKKKSSKKASDKSYVVEIPIDDPSVSGQNLVNTHHFNPTKGELWIIPLKNHKEATLKVFNKDGAEVFGLHATDKTNHWNGLSNQGVRLKSGKYLYVLDFGNGNIEHGHVVINP